ncbi:MAG: response regulator, partial [Spirochaetales bacterium]|nr:response regulator [Spirochaetales bacterium]
LESEGYRVTRAANGADGILAAYREIPDLIIMDVEMPLMQGYQASRLLKSRRGVRDIPILMHTSLSEDKDKYWAVSCGADDFINKDFDNLGRLVETVGRLSEHGPYAVDVIRQDAERMDRDRVFEMLGSLLDVQLFRSTVLNLLAEAGRSIGSLEETAERILGLLPKVCEPHLAVILIKEFRGVSMHVLPSSLVYRAETEDFLRICSADFADVFPDADMDAVVPRYLGMEGRADFDEIRLDKRRISSYYHCHLIGTGGTVMATLHIGNLTNNYFSDTIVENLGVFADGAGTIVENSVLFVHIRELESRIRHVFSKFVPAEVIDDLLARGSDEALMVGEKRTIVVLFSDIRSFTSISEHNKPEDVVAFLNKHFSVMVEVIKRHGGSIDKFIGDAIFAIFGAPVSYEDNAMRAIQAAVDMIQAMSQVETGFLTLPATGYAIGIGVHEGPAIVGNIGSSDKFDYTAIGDTVNIASRLEGLTKHYHRRILVSEEIAAKTGSRFDLREVDRVKVKGKLNATSLFAVEDVEDALPEEARSQFDKGMKLYKQGNWETALDYFRGIGQAGIDDPISQAFIERCEEFLRNPPESWDGAIALDFK